MKFSAAIISALVLGATAQDAVFLNCKFPSKWSRFHETVGDAWDGLRKGIKIMNQVSLSATYETAPKSNKFGNPKTLGKLRFSKKDSIEGSSNATELFKRGFVAGNQAFEITKLALCSIIKYQIPEVTCAYTDDRAFPC
jgi:hypothetical protein